MAALTQFEYLKDIDLENPELIQGEVLTVNDVDAIYRLGETPRAFRVVSNADIVVTAQNGTVLIKGRDYFVSPTKADQDYTNKYGYPIFSQIKVVYGIGVYTVTYMMVGSYCAASLFSYLRLKIKELLSETIPTIQNSIASLWTALNNLSYSVSAHTSNNAIHVTSYQVSRWDNNRTQTFVCDNIAARDALTGMKKGDICKVIVGANEDGKTETYIYNANAWAEITDTDLNPDVMRMTNRNAAPSATTGRLSIYAIADKLFGRTSSGVIKRFADIADGAAVTSGSPAVFQADGSIAAGAWQGGSGGGNVTGPASSVVDEIATFNNTTGTLIKSSGKKIGNASGNVPLANGTECVNLLAANAYRLKRMPTILSGSIIGTAWERGAGVAFSVDNNNSTITDMPPGIIWGNVEVYGASGDTVKVIVRDSLSLLTYIVHAHSQGNGGWKKIQNGTGGAGESQRLYTDSVWLISKMPDGMIIAVYGYNGSVSQLGSLGEVDLTLPVSVFSVMPIVLASNANSNSVVLGGWMTNLTTVHIKNNSTLVSNFKFALIGY